MSMSKSSKRSKEKDMSKCRSIPATLLNLAEVDPPDQGNPHCYCATCEDPGDLPAAICVHHMPTSEDLLPANVNTV